MQVGIKADPAEMHAKHDGRGDRPAPQLARVLVLEAAPFDERGGNSRFTAGALRFVYNGVDDLLKLCDLSETELATSDFGTYTQDKYYDDLGRVLADPAIDAIWTLGAAQAIDDVLGGRLDGLVGDIPTVIGPARAGTRSRYVP